MVCTVFLFLFSMTSRSPAQTVVPQAGPNPIVFNQTATTDNMIPLMAAAAEHTSDMTVMNLGFPKHFWMTNFTNVNDYFKWNVSLAAGADYHIWALLNTGAAVPLEFTIEGTSTKLDKTTRAIGWDKLDCGTIAIPTGTSKLVLKRISSGSGTFEIKSLELVRESDRAAYQARIADFKKSTDWLSKSKYGLMFQYGPWGAPKTGNRKNLEDFANGWDVTRFVNMVKGTGASYVLWSITLCTYQLIAPIKAVDSIMGNSTLTSTRDVLGEIAAALQKDGIKFYMYYHSGLNQQPDWLAKQNWPTSTFTPSGTGDKSTFFNNWVAVISEIGSRLGTNLDGYFFDDACNYYPAPFERLGAATRVGNPNRSVSWNAWVAVRYTDFQNVQMGEGYHGEAGFGSPAVGSNGVYTDGAQLGLLAHGMFILENSWGICGTNATITLGTSFSQALSWVKNASSRGTALSLCMMMYEDETCNQPTLSMFASLDSAVASHPQYAMKNNTDANIKYTGTWTVSSGRNANDYRDDIKSTQANGDFFEFTFTGTGVDYIAPKDAAYGSIDIYLDNVLKQTVSAVSTIHAPLQTLYGITGLTNGSHILKGVKKDGASMAVDAFTVYNQTVVSTAAPRPAAPHSVLINENFQIFGDKILFSPKYAGKEITYAIYDMTGKRLRNASTLKLAVNLRHELKLTDGHYLVRIVSVY
jgi:hypothetical protein